MEDWAGGADAVRGAGGPLAVSDTKDHAHPLCETYLQAAREAQLPINPDYNGAGIEGAFLYQFTTKGGQWASTARCYLRPAMRRANLEVRTRAQATRVLMEDGRAVGVEYLHGGKHGGKLQVARVSGGPASGASPTRPVRGAGIATAIPGEAAASTAAASTAGCRATEIQAPRAAMPAPGMVKRTTLENGDDDQQSTRDDAGRAPRPLRRRGWSIGQWRWRRRR